MLYHFLRFAIRNKFPHVVLLSAANCSQCREGGAASNCMTDCQNDCVPATARPLPCPSPESQLDGPWYGSVRFGAVSRPSPCLVGSPPATVCDFGGIADVNRQVVVGRRATYTHTHTQAEMLHIYLSVCLCRSVCVCVCLVKRGCCLCSKQPRGRLQPVVRSFIIVQIIPIGTYGQYRYLGSLQRARR